MSTAIEVDWIDAPPVVGEEAESRFVEVPGLYVGNPDIVVNQGWVQFPDGGIIPDNFHTSPGWIGRTSLDFAPVYDPLTMEVATRTASALAAWARSSTFNSFRRRVVLGVTIEWGETSWSAADNSDPDDADTIIHLDWVNNVPSIIALGSKNLSEPDVEGDETNNKYEGTFEYYGTSEEDGDLTKYRDQARSMKVVKAQAGHVYAADARRGLHSRVVMLKNSPAFERLFFRGFVAPRPELFI